MKKFAHSPSQIGDNKPYQAVGMHSYIGFLGQHATEPLLGIYRGWMGKEAGIYVRRAVMNRTQMAMNS